MYYLKGTLHLRRSIRIGSYRYVPQALLAICKTLATIQMSNKIYSILLFIINAFSSSNAQIELGEIGIKLYKEHSNSLLIIENNDTIKNKFPERKSSWFINPIPLNNSDSLIIYENFNDVDTSAYIFGQLILMDQKCNVFDTIYKLKSLEYIQSYFPTDNDSLVLIHVCQSDSFRSGYNLAKSKLNIYDFERKSINNIILPDSIAIEYFNQSPWSPENNQFIVSINKYPYLLDNNEIFIYDLNNSSLKRIEKGDKPVWYKKKSREIVYIKNNKLLIHNIETNKNTVIYKSENNRIIDWCRFSNNGKFLVIRGHIEKKMNGYIDASQQYTRIIRLSDMKIFRLNHAFREGDYWN